MESSDIETTNLAQQLNSSNKYLTKFHRHIEKCECFFCDYSCNLISTLENHVKIKHNRVPPFKCEVCDTYFDSRMIEYFKHLTTHIIFNCTECDYKFVNVCDLNEHLESTSHLEVVHCKFCEYKCAAENVLNYHIFNNHNLKPKEENSKSKIYNCKLCNFTADQLAKMVLHLKSHPQVETCFNGIIGKVLNEPKNIIKDDPGIILNDPKSSVIHNEEEPVTTNNVLSEPKSAILDDDPGSINKVLNEPKSLICNESGIIDKIYVLNETDSVMYNGPETLDNVLNVPTTIILNDPGFISKVLNDPQSEINDKSTIQDNNFVTNLLDNEIICDDNIVDVSGDLNNINQDIMIDEETDFNKRTSATVNITNPKEVLNIQRCKNVKSAKLKRKKCKNQKSICDKLNIFDQMLCDVIAKDSRLNLSDKQKFKFHGITEQNCFKAEESTEYNIKNMICVYSKKLYIENANKKEMLSNVTFLNSLVNSNIIIKEELRNQVNEETEELNNEPATIKKGNSKIKQLKNYNRHKGNSICKVRKVRESLIYNCNICPYSTRHQMFIVEHNRKHSGEKPFSCTYCEFKCARKGGMRQHIKYMHQEVQPIICEECGSILKSNKSFKTHQRTHSGLRPYSCNCCPMTFSEISNLRRHERIHTGEKPFACPECDYKTIQSNSLKAHMKTHNTYYKCKKCNTECSDYVSYLTHKKTHKKLLNCKYCEFVTIDINELRSHNKLHRSKNTIRKTKQQNEFTIESIDEGLSDIDFNPIICTICDYSTKSHSDMEEHLKVHEKEMEGLKSFCCLVCGYRCYKKIQLKNHIKIHPEWKLCKRCDHQAENLSCLRHHVRQSHCKQLETENNERSTTDNDAIALATPVIDDVIFEIDPSQIIEEETHFNIISDLNEGLEIQESIYEEYDPEIKISVVSEETPENVFQIDQELYLEMNTFEENQNNDEKLTEGIDEFIDSTNSVLSDNAKPNEVKAIADSAVSFLCDHCGETYKSRTGLVSHLVKHQDPYFEPKSVKPKGSKHFGRLYQCKQCNFDTRNKDVLTVHNNIMHDKDKPLQCSICTFRTTRQAYLNQHLKFHIKKSCPECDFTCFKTKHMKLHLIKHQTTKNYKCSICSISYKYKNSLTKHLKKNVCLTERKVIKKDSMKYCSQCNYKALTEDKLLKHHKKKHNEDISETKSMVTCSICDFKCDKPSKLKLHLLSHDESRMYSCSMCDTAYKTKGSLRKHLDAFHPINLESKEKKGPSHSLIFKRLGHNTSNKTKLPREDNEIATETEENQFCCSECSFVCNNEFTLKSHVICHFINFSND